MDGIGSRESEPVNQPVLVRFADSGEPITVSKAVRMNVWAIGRPDYQAYPQKSANLWLDKPLNPGQVFEVPSGNEMAYFRVTEPAKAVRGMKTMDKQGVYVERLRGQEAEEVKGKTRVYLSWQDLGVDMKTLEALKEN